MAELVLFHHAQGQTEGFRRYADELRSAGHVVHTPDLFEGRTFDVLADGVRYAEVQTGIGTIIERGAVAVRDLPAEVVYAGFSLGVVPAQMLTQTRPGALGTLLLHGCIPTSVFPTPWPDGVPLQIHAMDQDEWFELDIAQTLVAEVPRAELFLYPGSGHLFADASLGDYDPDAAGLMTERVLAFLESVG